MAITKELVNDKIEVVNKWNIQVRTATVIKEDGTEITRSFNRKVLTPGVLDESENLVDTDLSKEDDDVKAICGAAWTTQVKADFKAYLIAKKTTPADDS